MKGVGGAMYCCGVEWVGVIPYHAFSQEHSHGGSGWRHRMVGRRLVYKLNLWGWVESGQCYWAKRGALRIAPAQPVVRCRSHALCSLSVIFHFLARSL